MQLPILPMKKATAFFRMWEIDNTIAAEYKRNWYVGQIVDTDIDDDEVE